MKRLSVLFRYIITLSSAASASGLTAGATPKSSNLRYPAPMLVSPQTIVLGTARTTTRMDPRRDYIIKCPKTKKIGSTILLGGHNYAVVGCHVTIPQGDKARRAFYIKGATGIVHFEGVLVDFSGGSEGDAWAINAPNAIVQIQRSRVEGLRGTRSGFHGDLIQPWGGAREIRIDRFTGSSYYQGFQLPDMHKGSAAGPILASRVNLTSLGAQTPDSGGFLLWVIPGTSGCNDPIKAVFSEFYVQGRSGRSPGRLVYPPADNHQCATTLAGRTVSFPRQSTIRGSVIIGPPPSGDFVPAGSVGENYNDKASVWGENRTASRGRTSRGNVR